MEPWSEGTVVVVHVVDQVAGSKHLGKTQEVVTDVRLDVIVEKADAAVDGYLAQEVEPVAAKARRCSVGWAPSAAVELLRSASSGRC